VQTVFVDILDVKSVATTTTTISIECHFYLE